MNRLVAGGVTVYGHVPSGLHVVDESGDHHIYSDDKHYFYRSEEDTYPVDDGYVGTAELSEEGDDDEGSDDSDDPSKGLKKKPDVESLPDDIKDKVLGVEELSDEQIDDVMGSVSEAALEALRRVRVRETDIYSLVDRIQQKVKAELDKEGRGEKSKSAKKKAKSKKG